MKIYFINSYYYYYYHQIFLFFLSFFQIIHNLFIIRVFFLLYFSKRFSFLRLIYSIITLRNLLFVTEFNYYY